MTDTVEKISLYDELVIATKDCVGIAAPQFIGHLVKSRLNKQSYELEPSDIAKLTDWIQIAASLVAKNTEDVDKLLVRVQELASEPPEIKKTTAKK